MNLYELITEGNDKFYLLAEDPTSAEVLLKKLLDKAGYGFSSKRKVVGIYLLSEELTCFPEDTPNFSSGHTLIISDKWK